MKQERSSIVQIIDQTYTRLIGVIPFQYQLGRAQERGSLYDSLRGDIVCAFENIARRMEGEEVPLFLGFKERRRIKRVI
jgi:septum formation inhibitor-activating ATPase MinD